MALNEAPERGTRTIYCAEGSIHLYSSEPSALTPADLYQAKQNPALRQLLKDCNIYLIAARPRILIDSEEVVVEDGCVHGGAASSYSDRLLSNTSRSHGAFQSAGKRLPQMLLE
jgi:hypothetical protein